MLRISSLPRYRRVPRISANRKPATAIEREILYWETRIEHRLRFKTKKSVMPNFIAYARERIADLQRRLGESDEPTIP